MGNTLPVVLIVVLLQALGGGTGPASADTVPDNGTFATVSSSSSSDTGTDTALVAGWQVFGWGSDGLPFETLVFTTKRATRVTITDNLCAGDRFSIFDGTRLLQVSSAVPVDFNCNPIIEDPDLAYRNPIYSHASFVLRPGSHELQIRATTNPFGGGGGYVRFDFPPRKLR